MKPGVVLVVTNECDPHADVVLSKLSAPRVRIDIEDLLAGTTSLVEETGRLTISTRSGRVRDDQIAAVWWRKPILPPNHGLRDAERASWEFLLDNFAALLDAKRWLNPPSSYWRASKKLLQLRVAGQHGLAIPRTVFTTTPSRDSFRATRVLCKSIVTQHSLQGTHSEESPGNVLLEAADVAEAGTYPALLQEYIDRRAELRITVVGDEVFGAILRPSGPYVDIKEVEDYAVDDYAVPAAMSRRLHDIMAQLRLDYCAFDFIVDESGESLFLEMNPNGQWLWIEAKLRNDISGSIARLLDSFAFSTR